MQRIVRQGHGRVGHLGALRGGGLPLPVPLPLVDEPVVDLLHVEARVLEEHLLLVFLRHALAMVMAPSGWHEGRRQSNVSSSETF